ncbi:unnamed protein product [Caenorhabditis bovis]|uniref:MYND-type domain-containing protein n=1 Tax=Caenorhabditis bovis TaxID=2654633 RepID=A0A8S1F4P3_9PELO|nr:unnamed protein product [Caenorhabditis bovis]
MSVDKSPLFEAIDKNDTDRALELLNEQSASERDPNKMSVLSAAAYRGNLKVAEKALEFGCDVNDKEHEMGYTPLMFAALSGNPDMCKYLMDAGAKMYLVNSIGKTASELAAFIGNHKCVAIINNHITIDVIDNILRPKINGVEVENYPDELAKFIHSLCASHEVHPVKIIFRFNEYPDSLKYKKKILYVIDRIFERQLRCKEGNEVMSLKLWIILFFMRETMKFAETHSDSDNAAQQYAKILLKWENGDEIRKPLDILLRNSVAAFPYKHSLVYDTLNKALSKSKPGTRPSAYEYIVQSLFGQRIVAVCKFCSVCGAVDAKKRCPECKLSYCSKHCQKFDWTIHKPICKYLKSIYGVEMSNDQGEMSLDEIQAQIQNIDV